MKEKKKIKKEIEKIIKIALKDNAIGKTDIEAARTVLTWAMINKTEAKKVNKKFVQNLEQNGFAEGRYLIGDDWKKKGGSIAFIMTIAGAQGYIKQINR